MATSRSRSGEICPRCCALRTEVGRPAIRRRPLAAAIRRAAPHVPRPRREPGRAARRAVPRAGKWCAAPRHRRGKAVAAMRQRSVDVPDKWTVSADGWGLGWTLYDWDGIPGYGHDGAAIGQYAYLRVVPHANLAVVLMTNGGAARLLYADLFRDLLAELADVTMPAPFAPAPVPPSVDLEPLLGTYRREGVVLTVSRDDDGSSHLRYEFVDDMRDMSPPLEMDLEPFTATVFAASGAGPSFSEDYMPVVFSTLTNGTRVYYVGMRGTPKVA
ncbi:serine hydrolase [Micromonospora sp. NPDC048842]|uniref:serine hydrolase n=1 Tax=Micromonospora sp. NPDC048842 TaxID=3154346 RepID=UPI0033CBA10A